MIPIHWFFKASWVFRTLFYRLFFAKVGISSYIGKPLFLKGSKGIVLGDNVRIFPNSRIEVHNDSKLIFEDNVSVGQGFHVISSNNIVIQNGTMISANVFISDTDHTFELENTPIDRQPIKVQSTRIGKNCFIGYGVVILPGTTLGDGCIVGANSTVRGNFPPNSIVVGTPAKVLRSK